MTKRKFYKTIFTVEVLSEKPILGVPSLTDLDYMITEGDCSGCVEQSDSVELNGLEAAKALESQESDPGFFNLDDDGNDADSDDDEDGGPISCQVCGSYNTHPYEGGIECWECGESFDLEPEEEE